MRLSKYVAYAEYKKHLDGDWRTVHNLWRHIRNYAGVYGYSKTEVDAFFEGESGGKKQVDAGNVIGLTQASIPYAAAGGALTESNADFYYTAGTKTLSVDTLAFTGGSILDSSGAISFGNENLVTTGTLASGNLTVTGIQYINDSANAKMTQGITLNQGANDDEILAFKSSDVAHGVTDDTETDTYGYIKKYGAATGGIYMTGLGEGNVGFKFRGISTTSDTVKSTAAVAPFVINSAQKTAGTGVTSVDANGNILVVRSNDTTQFIIDKYGNIYANRGCSLGFATFGTNATNTLSVAIGTAPTSSPADTFQMYSADQAAGNACPHIRTENGAILKLYQCAKADYNNWAAFGDIIDALVAMGIFDAA